MKKHKVATVALNQTPMDWDGNDQRLHDALGQLKREGADFACFPEMAICGYGCEDVFLSDYLYDECLDILERLIPETRGLAVAVGMPLKIDGLLYSALAFIVNGSLEGFYCKKHLANDGLHYEHRWFKPWPDNVTVDLKVCGKTVPAGDIVFTVGDISVGFEICEDAWVPNRLTGNYKGLQPAILMNPSASHFAFQKHLFRRKLVVDGSRMNDGVYLYANMCANEAGRIIYDGSCAIADRGRLISENRRFSFQEVQVDSAVVELAKRSCAGAGTVQVGKVFEESTEDVTAELTKPEDFTHQEEFVLAETLGLFDYMRKSFSKGFLLSLSGGVDSATCAALVYAMAQRAINELGIDEFKKRLSYFTAIQNKDKLQDIMPFMLTCVYQSTNNSGPVTLNAAEKLSAEINADYHCFDVQPMLKGYTETVSKSFGRELSWEADDLALQNIQARVRAPGIWMLTNLKGGLLLTTSNRSEAAVGYATMDGDTCGGLCPLGGTDKTFLRKWLRTFEKDKVAGCGPLPSLIYVNKQEPTAELRPVEYQQKDEEDLMPYDVLDFIEKASIRDKKSPAEIYSELIEKFSKDIATTFGWLQKFYALWSRNQWKRERYAPSFHMDDENLDPKTWCRYPILSGGYKRELRRLKEKLGL